MPSTIAAMTTMELLGLGSLVLGAGSTVASLAMGSPDMPNMDVAAAPGMVRQDTGAQVKVGTDDIKNQRLSGTGSTKSSTNTGSTLGGLGSTGLSI